MEQVFDWINDSANEHFHQYGMAFAVTIMATVALLLLSPAITTPKASLAQVAGEQADPCTADFDKNGRVDVLDLQILSNNLNKPGMRCEYDLVRNDCVVDDYDLQVFRKYYKEEIDCNIN